MLHKAGTRQNQGKPTPCTRCPQKQNTSATVAQGGAQGGAQGDAQGKMNTRQLGVHKADAQGAQGIFFYTL